MAPEAGGQPAGEGLVDQQQNTAPVGGRGGIVGHADFERGTPVAHDPVAVGLPGAGGRVGEDGGARIAIEDLPRSVGRPEGPAGDGIEGPQVAIALPVAAEGESDALGSGFPPDRTGVVGLEQPVVGARKARRVARMAGGSRHEMVAHDHTVESPEGR